MAKHGGLGRGLGALIKDTPIAEDAKDGGVARVPAAEVRPSPFQPRRVFREEELDDLVTSVRERGVLQPLLVRRAETGYELIAGERRLRAARAAGLETVPVIVLDVPDREALELALVENLQREDLNVIEEAEGYQALTDQFNLTQEQVAGRVGKARASVANALRLLDLPDTVRAALAAGQIAPGHGKVLLQVAIPKEQEILALRVIQESLSVRALEQIVQKLNRPARKKRASRQDLPEEHLRDLTDQLHRLLGTAVRIRSSRTLANGKKAKGSIEIDFHSNDELDRLLALLGVAETL
jgi:ParB family chromosome partitioning protein